MDAPFDLARTVAPVWWARGRWPSVDWANGQLTWVGWENEVIVWREVRQLAEDVLVVTGTGDATLDQLWASRVLRIDSTMPTFDDPVLRSLSRKHAGMRPWSAGSHWEGVISSIVGQSISVAAAATTERRLCNLFNPALELNGRKFWCPPAPQQLAASTIADVRSSGVTTTRAAALVEVGREFASGQLLDVESSSFDADREGEKLRRIKGVGPWTVQSALLWGIAAPDAHPTGDVALLRAARRHFPSVTTLRMLDELAAAWQPHRGWAARLLWLDLLGWDEVRTGHVFCADLATSL